jgi:hypothetical protein
MDVAQQAYKFTLPVDRIRPLSLLIFKKTPTKKGSSLLLHNKFLKSRTLADRTQVVQQSATIYFWVLFQ